MAQKKYQKSKETQREGDTKVHYIPKNKSDIYTDNQKDNKYTPYEEIK